jgi:hypothetical protein
VCQGFILDSRQENKRIEREIKEKTNKRTNKKRKIKE